MSLSKFTSPLPHFLSLLVQGTYYVECLQNLIWNNIHVLWQIFCSLLLSKISDNLRLDFNFDDKQIPASGLMTFKLTNSLLIVKHKLTMNSLPIKKKKDQQNNLHIWVILACIFCWWWWWCFNPLWWLPFCFNSVTFKIIWHKLLQIPTPSDISQSQVMIATNHGTPFFNVIIIHGCGRVSTFVEVIPNLKCWCHSWHWINQLPPQAYCSIWQAPVKVLSKLKQNYKQTHCSLRPSIAHCVKKSTTHTICSLCRTQINWQLIDTLLRGCY